MGPSDGTMLVSFKFGHVDWRGRLPDAQPRLPLELGQPAVPLGLVRGRRRRPLPSHAAAAVTHAAAANAATATTAAAAG